MGEMTPLGAACLRYYEHFGEDACFAAQSHYPPTDEIIRMLDEAVATNRKVGVFGVYPGEPIPDDALI
jgi:hypothetical protein